MKDTCPSEQTKNATQDGRDVLCRLASILRCDRLRSLVYLLAILIATLASSIFVSISGMETRLVSIEKEAAERAAKLDEIDRNVRMLVDRLIQRSP